MSSKAPMQYDSLGGRMILMLARDCALEDQGLGPNRVVQGLFWTETVKKISNLPFRQWQRLLLF